MTYTVNRLRPSQIPDALFLVKVQRAKFHRQTEKAYYALTLVIVEPRRFRGHLLSSRLYCSPKARWKWEWFRRDFYSPAELHGRGEGDKTQLVGLKGVVKISHIIFNGAPMVRFDGFAPARRWEELSPANLDKAQVA